jgi:calcineurin-like phosphoesterase family protein
MIQEDVFFEKLQNIVTKEDFVFFLKDFIEYFIENKENLENQSIEHFLEAMCAFIDGSENYYKNFNIDPNKLSQWRIFADILMASTVYE